MCDFRSTLKTIQLLMLSLLFIMIVGCAAPSENGATNTPVGPGANPGTQPQEPGGTEMNEEQYPIATITLENGGVITIELLNDVAPNTVRNFIALANEGFYDGLIFHRVIPGFMIQGGDPTGTGMSGPGYSIKGEFASNGHVNDIQHVEGVVSMARSNNPDSAGSQFFITLAKAGHLDGSYAAFGRVTSGMEHAQVIAATKRDRQDRPETPQVIKEIRVDTIGETYAPPEKIGEQ